MGEYAKQQNITLTKKLREIQKQLPDFTNDFFRGIADTTQIKTRVAYAYDLRIFFYYLYNASGLFSGRSSERDFYVSDLDSVSATDIEKYSEYLNMYELPNYKNAEIMITYTNTANGKMRKLASLRSFYKYYFKKELIKTNSVSLVDLPKLREKEIIRLEPNEVVTLLDDIESGEHLTKAQSRYHEKNYRRDLAIIALLLGTGIRISECVGLNIKDFDFSNNSFTVTRKGGAQAILFISEEVKGIIGDYIKNDRMDIIPLDIKDEDALFLSLQKKRMTVSSIEKMLKKYSQASIPLKKISPHKLRSTFGTNLYRETDDIYLVADVLGHKDVNTTKKHYAAIEEDKRKIAAKVTKLRED